MNYQEAIKHFAPLFQWWGNSEPDEYGYCEQDPDQFFLGKQCGMVDTLAEMFNKDFFDVRDDLENAKIEEA